MVNEYGELKERERDGPRDSDGKEVAPSSRVRPVRTSLGPVSSAPAASLSRQLNHSWKVNPKSEPWVGENHPANDGPGQDHDHRAIKNQQEEDPRGQGPAHHDHQVKRVILTDLRVTKRAPRRHMDAHDRIEILTVEVVEENEKRKRTGQEEDHVVVHLTSHPKKSEPSLQLKTSSAVKQASKISI